jgi:hypothetical protein
MFLFYSRLRRRCKWGRNGRADGFRYVKAGIVLLDLHTPNTYPGSMFPTRDPKRSAVLMKMMDALTDRHGRGRKGPHHSRH